MVANHNSSRQTVISGPKDALANVLEDLKQDGLSSKLLPVAGAFHSSLMQEAQKPLVEAIGAVEFHAPRCVVFQRHGAGLSLTTRRRFATQLGRPSSFVGGICERDQGHVWRRRACVPRDRSTKTSSPLVAEILKNRNDSVAVAIDPQRRRPARISQHHRTTVC